MHLQPRASRTRLVGLHGQAIKIALTAPPVEGAANSALLAFLATLLRVPRSSLSLVTGAHRRDKQVLVHTTDPEHLIRELTRYLAQVDKKKQDD